MKPTKRHLLLIHIFSTHYAKIIIEIIIVVVKRPSLQSYNPINLSEPLKLMNTDWHLSNHREHSETVETNRSKYYYFFNLFVVLLHILFIFLFHDFSSKTIFVNKCIPLFHFQLQPTFILQLKFFCSCFFFPYCLSYFLQSLFSLSSSSSPHHKLLL